MPILEAVEVKAEKSTRAVGSSLLQLVVMTPQSGFFKTVAGSSMIVKNLTRHMKNEDWSKFLTAGSLSRWVLWNKL